MQVHDPGSEPIAFEMREIEPFTFVWPSGEINCYDELMPLAFTATKGGKRAHFIIGRVYPDRPQLGQRRWRYNVFLTSSPGNSQGVISILDFVAGNNFEVDGEMASLIKLPSRKFLRENDPVPQVYVDFRMARFNEVVQGPYARSTLAVIAHREDVETMIRHAIIRASQRGLLRF